MKPIPSLPYPHLTQNLSIKTKMLRNNLYVSALATLREERKLRVFENKVLRRIFGPRSDEVTGDWRRLHN